MKIEILGSEYYDGAIPTDSGNFRKWVRINHPEIDIQIPLDSKKYALHDYSLILPFVNLAIEGTLENYLKLVLEYVQYCFRGNLDGEKNEITFNVKYKNEKDGVEKEFYFKGNADDLKDTVKKFNINKFMDQ
ncbi:hypothetical protein I5466_08905 [Citrobacter koseri]|uniref:hypothetical protein n=1 Tax=Citrobacter koseri TaxID=545 RepID=UPI001903A1A0|nr:hypothetical protein [Citrobacter koseri]MBJ9120924.1 hypothetical protein [Citrobacter koseri]